MYLKEKNQRFKRDRTGVKGKQDHQLIKIILQGKQVEKEKATKELKRRIKRESRYVKGLDKLPEEVLKKILD